MIQDLHEPGASCRKKRKEGNARRMVFQLMRATNKGTPKDCRSLHEGTTTVNILDRAFIRMNTD